MRIKVGSVGPHRVIRTVPSIHQTSETPSWETPAVKHPTSRSRRPRPARRSCPRAQNVIDTRLAGSGSRDTQCREWTTRRDQEPLAILCLDARGPRCSGIGRNLPGYRRWRGSCTDSPRVWNHVHLTDALRILVDQPPLPLTKPYPSTCGKATVVVPRDAASPIGPVDRFLSPTDSTRVVLGRDVGETVVG
jgi:hypothetical protein